jgi:hypothetical protein
MGERAMKGGPSQSHGESGSIKETAYDTDSRERERDSRESERAMKSHSKRTSGTNRDFDESNESDNQGHGHPREERGRSSD